MRIVLLGAPGSGKGTQAKRLEATLNLPHVSTGDLLRAAVAAKTALGLEAAAIMERGDLVSDELVLGILAERLGEDDATDGFILDGFPRNLAQAEALDRLLEELEQPVDHAILIDVKADAIIARLAKRAEEEGRADDTAETVRRRLDVYEKQTAPVIDYFNGQSKLSIVDGEATMDDVADRVMGALRSADAPPDVEVAQEESP